jgi:DNA-binding transcriptional ArsR family regulator
MRKMTEDPELRRLLWYVLGATRGGENRARIVKALRDQPANVNQLSTRLSMDYRLVTHHVEVLGKNSLLHASGDRYGRMYFLDPWLESHFEVFEEIARKLKFKFD